MGEKGIKTKSKIQEAAYELFAAKGFNAVTMKDICEKTGLSRGGLYRHYGSTSLIFEDIFRKMSKQRMDTFENHMNDEMPVQQIFEEVFENLREEMLDASNSLSLAIYEYSNTVNRELFIELDQSGNESWKRLLYYGVERKEITNISIEQAMDIILYSYQGVRMWSRIIPVSEEVVDHMIDAWKELLFNINRSRSLEKNRRM